MNEIPDNEIGKVATKITSKLSGQDDPKKFDIMLIIAVIGLIINIVKLYRQCNQEGFPTADNIGPIQKRRITWMAKRHLKKFDINGSDFTKEMLNEFKTMEHEQVVKVFAQAK